MPRARPADDAGRGPAHEAPKDHPFFLGVSFDMWLEVTTSRDWAVGSRGSARPSAEKTATVENSVKARSGGSLNTGQSMDECDR